MQLLIAMLIASLGLFNIASAQVEYTATDISGSSWQYDYTITNGTPINPIGEFTIFYALGQYSNLALESSPSSWSSIVVQPDPSLPADGFFDAQALDAGLASGKTAGGFSVEFTYLAPGAPGTQPFNIVDPNTYATLAAGETLKMGTMPPPTTAPEIDQASAIGGSLLLLGCLAVMRGRQARKC